MRSPSPSQRPAQRPRLGGLKTQTTEHSETPIQVDLAAMLLAKTMLRPSNGQHWYRHAAPGSGCRLPVNTRKAASSKPEVSIQCLRHAGLQARREERGVNAVGVQHMSIPTLKSGPTCADQTPARFTDPGGAMARQDKASKLCSDGKCGREHQLIAGQQDQRRRCQNRACWWTQGTGRPGLAPSPSPTQFDRLHYDLGR